MTGPDLTRVINNFFLKGANGDYPPESVETVKNFVDYLQNEKNTNLKKHKVALLFVCLNPLYWEFLKKVSEGAKKYFLPGHEVDMFAWTDMSLYEKDMSVKRDMISQVLLEYAKSGRPINEQTASELTGRLMNFTFPLEGLEGISMFELEPTPWPLPTLMRYHLFLQQEEKLKDYDYIFYCDVDMKFANYVGDEILGEGLTAALHPMYALRKDYWPPYEPNEKSASYIKRPGKVVMVEGKPRFMPTYFAGGFVGGRSKDFLEACKGMKRIVDLDFAANYVPIWNDESVLNKYLYENPPDVILTPSYVYPDSLIQEYYLPIWGQNYPPKIITLTKSFTVSKEGGEALQKMLNPK